MNGSSSDLPSTLNNNEVTYRNVPTDRPQDLPQSPIDEAMEYLLTSMKRLSTDPARLQEISKLLV